MNSFTKQNNIQIVRFAYSASAYKALDRSNLTSFCVGGDLNDTESD